MLNLETLSTRSQLSSLPHVADELLPASVPHCSIAEALPCSSDSPAPTYSKTTHTSICSQRTTICFYEHIIFYYIIEVYRERRGKGSKGERRLEGVKILSIPFPLLKMKKNKNKKTPNTSEKVDYLRAGGI